MSLPPYDPKNVVDHYVLGGADGRAVIAEPDLFVWARWFEEASYNTGDNPDPSKPTRRVAYTSLPHGGFVSTVFIGLDHSFRLERGKPWERPVVFETMSKIGDDWEDYFDRYCTWDEAVAGHSKIVREALNTIEHTAANLAQALAPPVGADTLAGGDSD